MCYHAYSLATQLNYDVKLVGYLDSIPHPLIHSNPHIKYVPLAPPPDRITKLPEMLQLPLKFLWTFIVLSWALLFRIGWDVKLILMQNPPALPTMFVCWTVARLKSAKFVIDWHNYMWSVIKDKSGIDQLTLPRLVEDGSEGKDSNKDTVVRRKPTREERDAAVVANRRKRHNSGEKKERKSLKRRYIEWVYRWEGACGRRADAGLCVTRAMREDLQRAWGVHAAVFYDRPPSCLDLPMKVVDMFGAGIPVLAKRFNCIGELVQDGQNGHLFDTATDLFQHLYGLATGFPAHCKKLHKLKQFVLDDGLPSWEENWATVAMPILAPNLDPHFERVMASEPADSE
ncbi:hypothetical protein ANCCAN_15948 [Ancylostoma caninum]|uniref:Glycosyltransferase subfamily 4-like N-terminal domain-containing protein n=1 Tax=Ancylostoma caninum TaxID=29170 RepID=A0A368G583_ANCCA|nr:hypothetical protein ANCCAN_15948 [Ancylostoma caninum]